jgi:hypothetical protein
VIEYDNVWGAQHAGVLENFAANVLDGTALIAPSSDGINGVRLANAIHLSSWTQRGQADDSDVGLAQPSRLHLQIRLELVHELLSGVSSTRPPEHDIDAVT